MRLNASAGGVIMRLNASAGGVIMRLLRLATLVRRTELTYHLLQHMTP